MTAHDSQLPMSSDEPVAAQTVNASAVADTPVADVPAAHALVPVRGQAASGVVCPEAAVSVSGTSDTSDASGVAVLAAGSVGELTPRTAPPLPARPDVPPAEIDSISHPDYPLAKQLIDAVVEATTMSGFAGVVELLHDLGYRKAVDLGGVRNHAQSITLSVSPAEALAERLVNSMESVGERSVIEKGRLMADFPSLRAAVQFGCDVPDAGIGALTPAEKHRLADKINLRFLNSDNSGPHPTVEIDDDGLAPSPVRIASTILSLNGDNKLDIDAFAGGYGKGGSMTFMHCEATTMLVHDGEHVAVVTVEESKDGSVLRYIWYVHEDTGLPFYVPAALFPDLTPGLKVRHINYQLGGIATANWRSNRGPQIVLNSALPSPALPFWLEDARDEPFNQREAPHLRATLIGSEALLRYYSDALHRVPSKIKPHNMKEASEGGVVESDVLMASSVEPEELKAMKVGRLNDVTLRVTYRAFTSRSKLQSRLADNEVGVVTSNGHRQVGIKRDVFKRICPEYVNLAQQFRFEVDIDAFTKKERQLLVSSSRNEFTSGETSEKFLLLIGGYLSNCKQLQAAEKALRSRGFSHEDQVHIEDADRRLMRDLMESNDTQLRRYKRLVRDADDSHTVVAPVFAALLPEPTQMVALSGLAVPAGRTTRLDVSIDAQDNFVGLSGPRAGGAHSTFALTGNDGLQIDRNNITPLKDGTLSVFFTVAADTPPGEVSMDVLLSWELPHTQETLAAGLPASTGSLQTTVTFTVTDPNARRTTIDASAPTTASSSAATTGSSGTATNATTGNGVTTAPGRQVTCTRATRISPAVIHRALEDKELPSMFDYYDGDEIAEEYPDLANETRIPTFVINTNYEPLVQYLAAAALSMPETKRQLMRKKFASNQCLAHSRLLGAQRKAERDDPDSVMTEEQMVVSLSCTAQTIIGMLPDIG